MPGPETGQVPAPPASGSGGALAADIAVMREAARAAGALALDLGRQEGLAVWNKSQGHPVTDADIAVNALLAERLGAARPDYGWLSEETPDDPRNRQAGRVWVVDPIDGTRAFMAGTPDWCVALAVVAGGEAVAGVIHAPATGEMFEAWRGGGAYLNGQPIVAGDHPDIAQCRMVASSQVFSHPVWTRPWPAMTLADPRPNATLLRIAHVAAGRQHATLTLWNKSDWDLAAGTVLIEEAGGRATTHRGERFCFNRQVPAQQSLVAAGKALHPLLIERTRPVELPDPNGAPETA